MPDCNGNHRIFCAEVVGIESEGKVLVINVCTSCEQVNVHEYKVSAPGTPLRLLKEEKEKKT